MIRFWETAHLPLPQANIKTYFSLTAKCWLGGGVGGQLIMIELNELYASDSCMTYKAKPAYYELKLVSKIQLVVYYQCCVLIG